VSGKNSLCNVLSDLFIVILDVKNDVNVIVISWSCPEYVHY